MPPPHRAIRFEQGAVDLPITSQKLDRRRVSLDLDVVVCREMPEKRLVDMFAG